MQIFEDRRDFFIQWTHNQGPHLFIDTSKSIDEIKITIQEFLNIHLKNPNDK